MRCALALLAACSSGATSLDVSTSASASASASTDIDVTSSIDEAPTEPAPEEVDVHLHETPSYIADLDKLYVEVTSEGEHAELLRKSAITGLTSTPYAVEVDDGGDLELEVMVASLTPDANTTSCSVKIFVLRMPQHDLLAIADGGASATGRDPTAQCLSATGTAIVRDKLPKIFQRQLEAKQ
jgi:hypothetical protein